MRAVVDQMFETTVMFDADGVIFEVPIEFVPRNVNEGDVVDIFFTESIVFDLDLATNLSEEIIEESLIAISWEWNDYFPKNFVGLKPAPLKGDIPIGQRIRGLRIIKNEAATEKAKLRIREMRNSLLTRNKNFDSDTRN